jgi:molybdate/tungstate transport system substrate-binding protein
MKLAVGRNVRIWICAILFFYCSASGHVSSNADQRLILFHAGSLAVPFEKIIEGFKKENPGVVVLKEIAGSRECARKITELNKSCDILASADYLVIDQLLIPRHADWNLKFATNEMTIVYSEKSRRAKEINRQNWYEILLDTNVSLGRADPDADPCGYRTIWTVKLAELYYQKPGLAGRLLSKKNQYMRPKEVDLVALLDTGELDYAFLYRSVAQQHGLKYLTLPDPINLKKAELEDYYRQATVELSGTVPGTRVTQRGGSMVYGVTIPRNAPHPELAKKFIHYLMDRNKGLKIMEAEGQPTVVPSVCDTYDRLPEEFRRYAGRK